MAFSVKQVKAKLQEYGVPAENLDTAAEYFCSAHKTDLDAIKEERDTLKTDVETLTAVKKELDGLKTEIAKNGKDPYESKYNALLEEHEKLKADIAAKKSAATKAAAAKDYFKGKGIDKEDDLEIVMRGSKSEIDALELDEKGKIKDAKALDGLVSGVYAKFVGKTTTTGAQTANPPANNGGSRKAKEEIYAIKDPAERQKAIFENRDLFGI